MLTNYGFKLRLLFLPLVLLCGAFLMGFGALYWLLVLRWQVFDPSSETLYWLPFAIGSLLVLLVLRPRLKLLQRGADDRWVTLFYLVPAFTLTFVALFSADYLTQATGRLTPLPTPADVQRQPASRFYSVRQAYVHKPGLGVHTVVSPAGKNNEKLRFDVYVACPILTSAADTATPTAALWLGWKQSETISASLPDAQKERLYRAFLLRCDSLYQATDLGNYRYLARVTAADGSRELRQAVNQSPNFRAAGTPVIVLPQTTLFAQRTQAPLRHLAWTLGLGLGAYLLMLVFPRLSATQAEDWLRGHQRPPGLWAEISPYVLPRRGYVATPLLVAVNGLVYAAMVLNGLGIMAFRSPDLLHWGATYGPAVQSGEWWRLLTGTFLHGGLLHILYNMVSLGLISWLLEASMGSIRLLALYLLSALGASLVSVWWHPNIVSVGASGAIFGLFGAAVALAVMPGRIPVADRGALLLIAGLFGGISLVLGFFAPFTDNAAHLGGLASGFLIGLLLTATMPRLAPNEQ